MKKFLVTVCVVMLVALPSFAEDRKNENESKKKSETTEKKEEEPAPAHLDWAYHDITRRSQLINHNQITLEFWGGLEILTNVNPLFGVNPFQTPFASHFTFVSPQTPPFSPFWPNVGTSTGPPFFPFVPIDQKPPVKGVTKTVGLIGFKAEIMPMECPFYNDEELLLQFGLRYFRESRHESFPFDRSEWSFQLLARVISTPKWSEKFAFQAKLLTGFGSRDWLGVADTMWMNNLEVEGSFRLGRASRNALFIRGNGQFFYEEDGVVATAAAEGHLGWRRIGEKEDTIDERRLFIFARAARRRDFEDVADLLQKSIAFGLGGEVRVGPFFMGGKVGFVIREEYKLTPLIIPPAFAGNVFTAPNAFAGALLNSVFTKIETQGPLFMVNAGFEF